MPLHRKRMSLPVIVIASAFALGACGQSLSPDDYIRKATTHISERAFSAASIELNNVLQQDPNNLEARWMMAQVALQLGDGTKAERDARRAIDLGTPRTEALPVLARALLLQEDATRLLTETSILPQDASTAVQATLLGLRGKALLIQGDVEGAWEQFEKARASDPRNMDTAEGIAFIQASRKQFDEARRTLDAALQANSSAPDTWSLLGDLELEQGNYLEADHAYTQAIAQRAYLTLDHAKRAHARVQLKMYAEADRDVATLNKLAKHPYVAYVTGLSLFRQGKLNEAANAFEASFNENPAFIPNRLYLATTRLMLGQTEQALQHADFIRSNAPKSDGANLLYGAIQINRADYGMAREALDSAFTNNPDHPVTVQLLATTALLDGNASQALIYAERLALLQPDSPQAMNTLMVAQLMAGSALPTLSVEGEDAYKVQLLLALQAFRDNKFEEAHSLAARLLQQHPEHIEPINLQAAIHLATGEWQQARVLLETILERQPGDTGARLNLAKLELHDRQFERIRTLISPIVKSSPGDEPAALLLVAAEHGLGNETAANAILEQLLRNNPEALLGRALLARRFLNASQPERTIELLRDLRPAILESAPIFLQLRGSAQLETGDIQGARSTFEHWTRVVPDAAVARFMLAESMMKTGEFKSAQTELSTAIRLNPRYLPARIGELRFLTQSNQFSAADDAAKRLVRDFGEQPEVLATTGWHALMTSNFVTAEDHLSRALAHTPSTETAMLLVRALWGQGKHDETFATLDKWIAAHPEDTAALLHLAGAQLDLGQEAEAANTYQRIINLHPDHVPSLNNAAWLSRNTKPDVALKLAQRAHELSPEDPFVLDTLGMLFLERRDLTQARWFISQALERNPENPQIRTHMVRVLIAQEQLVEADRLLQELSVQVKGTPLEDEVGALSSELQSRR